MTSFCWSWSCKNTTQGGLKNRFDMALLGLWTCRDLLVQRVWGQKTVSNVPQSICWRCVSFSLFGITSWDIQSERGAKLRRRRYGVSCGRVCWSLDSWKFNSKPGKSRRTVAIVVCFVFSRLCSFVHSVYTETPKQTGETEVRASLHSARAGRRSASQCGATRSQASSGGVPRSCWG